jgi:hypothetical protein
MTLSRACWRCNFSAVIYGEVDNEIEVLTRRPTFKLKLFLLIFTIWVITDKKGTANTEELHSYTNHHFPSQSSKFSLEYLRVL